jgi:hypothetical protein
MATVRPKEPGTAPKIDRHIRRNSAVLHADAPILAHQLRMICDIMHWQL